MRSFGLRIACAVPLLLGSLSVTTRTDQILPGAPAATLHFVKSPKQTTGVSLTLDEVSREKGRHGTMVKYRLTTSGFPTGKAYQLRVSSFSASKPIVYVTAIHADDSGALVGGSLQGGASLEVTKLILTIEDYNKGEFFMAEVVSDDDSVYAADRVHPFPIEAKDAGCHLWAELIKKDRKQFLIVGTGFGAGTDVRTASSEGDGKDLKEGTERIGSNDLLLAQVLHRKLGGTGTFVVTGQRCKVTLQYDFGRQAKGPE